MFFAILGASWPRRESGRSLDDPRRGRFLTCRGDGGIPVCDRIQTIEPARESGISPYESPTNYNVRTAGSQNERQDFRTCPHAFTRLAKELKVDSKDLVDLVKKVGITGKGSALASLSDEEAQKVRDHLSGAGKPEPTAAAQPNHANRCSGCCSRGAEACRHQGRPQFQSECCE